MLGRPRRPLAVPTPPPPPSGPSVIASPGVLDTLPPRLPARPPLGPPPRRPSGTRELAHASRRAGGDEPVHAPLAVAVGAIRIVIHGEVVVGRSRSADLVLAGRSISRQHALFENRDGELRVVDMASSNGVRVNGVRVAVRVLARGDVVQVGEHTLHVV